jgi:hypothetical protein
MGVMRFLVSPPGHATEDMLQYAYLSGLDRTAWLVRTRKDGDELVLEREVTESSSLNLLWEVEGYGLLALTTATLIERPQPYLLPLELARGTITQLRNQLFDWQMIGLVVPDAILDKTSEAIRRLSWAAVTQDDDPTSSATAAQEALCLALHAAQLLANTYAEQVIGVRKRASGKMTSWLGGELAGPPLDSAMAQGFLAAFNAALVPTPWREIEASEGEFSWSVCDAQIEWCRARGLKICAGPLLQIDEGGLPDWIYLWEDDFDNLLAAFSQFVRAAVERYRGKVDLWQCAARVNTAEVLALSEEEELRLAAATVHLARTLDPNTPLVISIDQPWGEYMGRREVDFPPLHFADALVRAGLDVKALLLEVNLGLCRGGTLPRSPLEFARLLDYWSVLGLPLFVSLSVPGGGGDDPRARRQTTAGDAGWSPEAQQRWIARYLPVILAKPNVQGVFWNQLSDHQPHDFPHAGLFNERRKAKPALKTLASIRQAHLK